MNNLKTLTVYLGSSGHTRPVFREAAERFRRRLSANRAIDWFTAGWMQG